MLVWSNKTFASLNPRVGIVLACRSSLAKVGCLIRTYGATKPSQGLILRQELCSHVAEILRSLLIIVWATQIFPVAAEGKRDDVFASPDQFQNQIRKIKVLIFGDVIQHSRLKDIDTHADHIINVRLFRIPRDHTASLPEPALLPIGTRFHSGDIALRQAAFLPLQYAQINMDLALV